MAKRNGSRTKFHIKLISGFCLITFSRNSRTIGVIHDVKILKYRTFQIIKLFFGKYQPTIFVLVQRFEIGRKIQSTSSLFRTQVRVTNASALNVTRAPRYFYFTFQIYSYCKMLSRLHVEKRITSLHGNQRFFENVRFGRK